MHIIIGFLGSVVTVLYLLHRLAEMGIDLGGLNPFLWQRRRQWKKKYQGNPVFQLDNPMDATALLMAAAAKVDGDISAEQKRGLLELFEREFKLSRRDASSLLIASTHLLGDGAEVRDNVDKVLAPSREKFSEAQAASAAELIGRVAQLEGEASTLQTEMLKRVESALDIDAKPSGTW